LSVKNLLVVGTLATGLAFGQEDPASRDEKKRAPEKRAAVMGMAAAAGASLGAAIAKDDRAKGAIMGAAVGGLAGFIIDQILKKRDRAHETGVSAPPVETQ